MNPLQKYKAHSSQQFGRLRSNMFGENRLTDTCRAVFSKRAAPMSHDFFSCQGPRQAPCAGHALRGAPRRALLARTRLRWICNPVIPSHAPADCKSRRNIKDNHAETPKATIPKHRSQPRRCRQQTMHRRRMAISSTSRLLSPARDAYGRRWQKAAGLQIRLDNKSRQKITNQLKL